MSGLPGAIPHPGPHHAVPAAERQGAPVDFGKRGACHLGPPAGAGLLPAAPGLLPCRHGNAASLPAARRGVHRPEEPQVRDAASVGDVGVSGPLLLDVTRTRFIIQSAISLLRSSVTETNQKEECCFFFFFNHQTVIGSMIVPKKKKTNRGLFAAGVFSLRGLFLFNH